MSRRRRPRGVQSERGKQALKEIEAMQRAWVPERVAESVVEEGKVVVLAPKFKGRFGKALLNLLKREQTFRLKLDEVGTAVWELIDGVRDVGDITDEMVERFDDSIEPALPRLLEFLRMLRNTGSIVITSVEKRK
jgi:hypothetical protein